MITKTNFKKNLAWKAPLIFLLVVGSLIGIPFLIFFVVLGSGTMPNWEAWKWIISFFLFFGIITWIIKLVSGRLFMLSAKKSEDWERIRSLGKSKYIKTLGFQISLLVMFSLSGGFLLFLQRVADNFTIYVISYIFLLVVAIAASFHIASEIWKRKEYDFHKAKNMENGQ